MTARYIRQAIKLSTTGDTGDTEETRLVLCVLMSSVVESFSGSRGPRLSRRGRLFLLSCWSAATSLRLRCRRPRPNRCPARHRRASRLRCRPHRHAGGRRVLGTRRMGVLFLVAVVFDHASRLQVFFVVLDLLDVFEFFLV